MSRRTGSAPPAIAREPNARRRRAEVERLPLPVALLLLLPSLALGEPPRVDATVDRRELGQDELLRLSIRVEGSDLPTQLDPPGKPFDFEIVGRSQSQQTSMTFQGGRIQATHAFTWELGLAPRRTGTLTVPPFVVTVGAAKQETAPIQVKVLPAGSRPRGSGQAPARAGPPGGTWRGWERDLRLEVQLDRRRPWLGQQVTASVYLVSPVGVLRMDGFKPPSYDGFWAETLDVPQRLEPERRVVNGVPLRAFLLQRIALFPTRAGKLVIAPFQADVTVQLLSGNRLFSPFSRVEQVHRASAPVELDVQPLPAGAPAGFESVNVGSLALEVAPSERSIPAGEPLAVRVTARGEGNVRAWGLPPLPPIAGTRRYEPTTSDALKPSRGRIAGSRTVETLLVPDRPGELVIPPLAWPWFDAKAGRYQVARTPELRVTVTPRAGMPAAPAGAALAELRPIRAGEPLRKAGPPPWRRAPFAALLLLPPLAFAGLALSERLRERARIDAPARRVRGAVRASRRRLAAAERRLRGGDAAGFVAEVERALAGYAADKLGRPVTGLTRDALAQALTGAGAHPPAVRALLSALDGCDAARYGGAAAAEPLLDAAAGALAILEDGDWKRGTEAGS